MMRQSQRSRKAAVRGRSRPHFSFEALEPRLLLSHRPGHGGEPPPPPADPAIAVTASDTKGGDLMVMNADGSNQTRILSRDGWTFSDASWSPLVKLDGTRSLAVYAFVGFNAVGQERGLRVVDVKVIDGTPKLTNERILDPDARVGGLAWSPDGQWIAYAEAPGGASIWMNLIPAVGGTPITVIDSTLSPRHPTWSLDGTRLAYVRLDSSNIMPNGTPEDSIWVKNLDVDGDGTVTSADLSALNPLDPGTGILFERDTSINFMEDPDWSRNGTIIAFSGHLPDGVFHIFTVDAGLGLSSLQTVPSTQRPGSPSWSSDDPVTATNETDRFLVYSEPAAANGNPGIVRQDLATGTETVLAVSPKIHFRWPDWARFPTAGWAPAGGTSSTASGSLAAAETSSQGVAGAKHSDAPVGTTSPTSLAGSTSAASADSAAELTTASGTEGALLLSTSMRDGIASGSSPQAVGNWPFPDLLPDQPPATPPAMDADPATPSRLPGSRLSSGTPPSAAAVDQALADLGSAGIGGLTLLNDAIVFDLALALIR